jgi:hypothetical protein
MFFNAFTSLFDVLLNWANPLWMTEKTTPITQYLEIVIHSSLMNKNASNEVQSPWYSTLFV